MLGREKMTLETTQINNSPSIENCDSLIDYSDDRFVFQWFFNREKENPDIYPQELKDVIFINNISRRREKIEKQYGLFSEIEEIEKSFLLCKTVLSIALTLTMFLLLVIIPHTFIPEDFPLWHWLVEHNLSVSLPFLISLPTTFFLLPIEQWSKDINRSILMQSGGKEMKRIKNITLVDFSFTVNQKVDRINQQFSRTMGELLSLKDNALSHSGWECLFPYYDRYMSLYIFLSANRHAISSSLMDEYSKKLNSRYKEFYQVAQDVIANGRKYQKDIDVERDNARQLKQKMLDDDALRAIPLDKDGLF